MRLQRAAFSLLPWMLGTPAALAQTNAVVMHEGFATVGKLGSPLDVASRSFTACIVGSLRTGTKIDFSDAAVNGALSACKAQHAAVRAAEEASTPLAERQTIHDKMEEIASDPQKQRNSVRFMAMFAFMNLKPWEADTAAGTTGSK